MKFVYPILILFTISCRQAPRLADGQSIEIYNTVFKGKIIFKDLSSRNGFKLLLVNEDQDTTDQTIFQYTAYQLDTADINRDGETDVLVGLIKSTRFDPVEKRRLFILRIDEDEFRPMWLGTKVCHELIDFKSAANGLVTTLEKMQNETYAIGHYQWQGFGLSLIQYTQQENFIRICIANLSPLKFLQ